eukprot:TRINITY_DN4214_c0_g1_i1.p1 TRINITY_DN4214_c0_g1~~TRINITY_DN4214_c0_g1_i1.p1  ORF type:complete len:1120 (-),score=304.71 TRINITY_DN4214_c0_g1_i1:125-3484(-)
MDAAEQRALLELFASFKSKENAERKKAEVLYAQEKAQRPAKLLIGMLQILGNTELEMPVRRHVAILLRGLLVLGSERDFIFPKLTTEQRCQVAAEILLRFEHEPIAALQQSISFLIATLVDYVCDPHDPRGSLSPGSPTGWPDLLPTVFRLANPATTSSAQTCERALMLLRELLNTLKDEIMKQKEELGALLQGALSQPVSNVKFAACMVICEIVKKTEKVAWAPLANTAGALVGVLQQLKQEDNEDKLQLCMQAFVDVAGEEPDFFKGLLSQDGMEPARFCAGLAQDRSGFANGLRSLALEWLITYCEHRSKWLRKSLPNFAPLTLEVCMRFMLEVDDGEAELKQWLERKHQEEGEEDVDELFHAGEQAIDRLVRAMEIDVMWQPLSACIAQFAQRPEWQAVHAALTAVRQTGEFVEEDDRLQEMVKLVLMHAEHQHPRVRNNSMYSLGQLANDHSPHLQELCHATVMPALLKMLGDPCDRVAAMAMAAFVSFAEKLDNTLMTGYAEAFMAGFVKKLQETQHSSVREEAITCIAVVAEVLGKDFSAYYDRIMPLLKQLLVVCTTDKENRLRGKAFECMSLLGMAVGKERFLPDAKEAVAEMLKTPLEADDVQREYIKQASERICHTLKTDFVHFLPAILPGLFKPLRFEQEGEAAVLPDGDDEYVKVTAGQGKFVMLRTSQFDQMYSAVQQLHTFVFELEAAYYDWVPATAEALLPLLSTTEEVSPTCDLAWAIALRTWSLLIKSARLGQEQRGITNADLPRKLLVACLQNVFPIVETCFDAEVLTSVATGIAECIKGAGPGSMTRDETLQMARKVFVLLDQSFARSEEAKQWRQQQALGQASLPQELHAGEDGEWQQSDANEGRCRKSHSEILGAVMQIGAQDFTACLPEVATRIDAWLKTTEHKVLGLRVSCLIVQHLKEHSKPVWGTFMPATMQMLADENAEARCAAAYIVNLAAPIPEFSEAAPEAFRRIAAVISQSNPKKKEQMAQFAVDNEVAALFRLAKSHQASCPPEVQPWKIVAQRLPLWHDDEEARKVHAEVADLVLGQHPAVVGDRSILAPVLGALSEVVGAHGFSTEETDAKIKKIFSQISVDELKAFAGQFTDKQRRKIDKLMTS